ncbi:MAG: glycoside hydrolase family 2 protein [Velocimicrobium sp.]
MNYKNHFTKEGENLSDMPWQEYPRPQLKRESYVNLNGKWEFALSRCEKIPDEFPMQILVPFPPESILSGIHKRKKKREYLFYKKKVVLPPKFIKDKVLLHFGAVDQIATIYINGIKVMTHVGGYLPFSADITPYLKNENVIVVKVKDTLNRDLPYGKQKDKRGGMWYTPVSGIWQTVWIESVSSDYIRELKITPTLDSVRIQVDSLAKTKEILIKTEQGIIYKKFEENEITISIHQPKTWSPEQPYLYEFEMMVEGDRITSYFALRTLCIKKVNGISRLCLNGEPYFFHGLLDQGYFSDGIYLPADVKNYENDISTMKELGFNMLRKHIKVEPAMYYHLCDKLGMIVFQDMVNNGHYFFLRDTILPTIGLNRINDSLLFRTKTVKDNFRKFTKETIKVLYNVPSICYWTIFNEGWGQFESDKMYELVKQYDDSRFIDSTSGWFCQKKSDVDSKHIYFSPVAIKEGSRPVVLSEFGGYSCKLPKYSYNLVKTYGYRFYNETGKFQEAIRDLYLKEVIAQKKKGLCASIYTQVSDVEDETNGLLTYDRRVLKVDKEEMQKIAKQMLL